ncbi:hypothetical protein FRB95_013191 [Tulasnella sp. JGI-2019a]|nr:hypothetical protein FRB95_013191 [Tulasnella sp. JGI-2019a]
MPIQATLRGNGVPGWGGATSTSNPLSSLSSSSPSSPGSSSSSSSLSSSSSSSGTTTPEQYNLLCSALTTWHTQATSCNRWMPTTTLSRIVQWRSAGSCYSSGMLRMSHLHPTPTHLLLMPLLLHLYPLPLPVTLPHSPSPLGPSPTPAHTPTPGPPACHSHSAVPEVPPPLVPAPPPQLELYQHVACSGHINQPLSTNCYAVLPEQQGSCTRCINEDSENKGGDGSGDEDEYEEGASHVAEHTHRSIVDAIQDVYAGGYLGMMEAYQLMALSLTPMLRPCNDLMQTSGMLLQRRGSMHIWRMAPESW